MLIADMTITQWIPLIIVVVVVSFLLMRTSRYFARPKSAEPSWSSVARRSKERHAPGVNIPQEMANWEVEMHEFVREIKAELDSKMRALQAVTAEADRAATRLEAVLRATGNPANYREREVLAELLRTSPSSTEATARQEPCPAQDRPSEIAKSPLLFREDMAKGKQGIDLSNLPSSQADSLSPAGVPRAEHSSAQAKKEEIYTLADYGMKPAEIASRVKHPIGEVELILSLRGKK
jgi:hypothetical protein